MKVISDIFLLLARLVLGAIMIAHGWRRYFVDGMQSQIDYLNQFAVPQSAIFAYGATILELVGGVFLIVGALTPFVALAYAAQMGMTIAWTNWFRGPFLATQGYEYHLALGAFAMAFVGVGAGRASIDGLFRRGRAKPKTETSTLDDTYV